MPSTPQGSRNKPVSDKTRKTVIIIMSAIIVVLALIAVVPVIYAAMSGPGNHVEQLNADRAKSATTDVNGNWKIDNGAPPNVTAAGFTFDEVLPGQRKRTSGSTQQVTGNVDISDGKVRAGEVHVDMRHIVTDKDVRDENVRNKILLTDRYPEARFSITKPVNVSQLPSDGKPGKVTLTGNLTIKDATKEVTQEFQALRDGDRLVVSGVIPVKRSDYDVESPDFIAAKIAEEGEIDILINMSK